jgi:hypothetical protein
MPEATATSRASPISMPAAEPRSSPSSPACPPVRITWMTLRSTMPRPKKVASTVPMAEILRQPRAVGDPADRKDGNQGGGGGTQHQKAQLPPLPGQKGKRDEGECDAGQRGVAHGVAQERALAQEAEAADHTATGTEHGGADGDDGGIVAGVEKEIAPELAHGVGREGCGGNDFPRAPSGLSRRSGRERRRHIPDTNPSTVGVLEDIFPAFLP